MDKLRDIQALTLMHKIIQGKAPKYLIDKITFLGDIHTHQTRTRDDIRTNHFKTNFGKNCFFNAIGKKYNEVTNLLNINQTISVDSFKNKLKKHFLALIN